MQIKSATFTVLLALLSFIAKSQENKLLITFKDSSSNTIKKGDYVRMAYPSAKLDIKSKNGRFPEIVGIRGKVDSISSSEIWLIRDKRSLKKQAFNIADIDAIKEVSKSGELMSFIGSTLVIGTAAVIITDKMELNPGAVAFAGAFSLFPAAILTGNVYYPTKPKKKVGEDYSLDVITIN
ncbi:hypothetical protein BCY91_15575 [Pelobium manganitolerans]|uniref:Uncharacterized protein n=1 Tax=Pelobium manganitolerans TaxID=1842495 RepID=A0A419S8L4_9SPHI|nr:hypothetical protein [Pelobium manganitolerans]RKD18222.1 hypothetical protein BCY91_15575 [Pelobium manganitolerans]